ncbi:MAG: alginate export family protein [Nitrospirae bacterium]|nr:alginate export family protein [Nitrospirota bacterium]
MTTRVELNAAALGALLLIAVHLGAQPAWAGETQAAVSSPEEQRTDRPSERRLGPLARRFQEIIFSDDLRLNVPQSPLHLDQMLHVPEWLHLGLDFRTRYEAYSQPVKKNETTGGAQFSERTDVNLEARYKPFKFHLEFLDARPLYNYGLTVSSRMENQNDVLQLYGSVGTDNFLESGLPAELQIGKFTQAFGKSRLIARSNYSNVPFSFVGAHWTLGPRKDWEVRAFVMRPVQNHQTSPDTVPSNTLFSGMSYLDQRMPWLHTELYVYYISQNEQVRGTTGINQDQSTQGQLADLYTPGFRLFKPEAKATFDYEIESSYQFGRSALKPGSPLLTTFAYFQHAEIGYTFALPWTPSIRFKYDYASGDNDPHDNQNGRFNPLFGTQNFPFTYTGIWSLFKRANISSPGYVASVEPLKDLHVIFKQRFWWLAQARDEFVGTGLQDQTGQAGKYVGSELDLRLAWTVSPNMVVEGGWLYLMKGSYYSNLLKQGIAGAPNDKNTDYVFLSLRLFF